MKKEMSNKILLIALCSILLISFLSFVLAAGDSSLTTEVVKAGVIGFKDGLKNVLSPLFEDTALFTKLLFGVLLWMIIYSITGTMFESSRWITWFIALIITVITMIAVPGDFLGSVMLSYGAMGAAILAVIPFVIILIFTVRIQSLLLGRLVWIFFCVYYFAIAIYDWAQQGYWTPGSIVYGFAIIAGILAFVLIGAIRNAIFKGEMGAIKESGKAVAKKGKLLHQLQSEELETSYGTESSGNR